MNLPTTTTDLHTLIAAPLRMNYLVRRLPHLSEFYSSSREPLKLSPKGRGFNCCAFASHIISRLLHMNHSQGTAKQTGRPPPTITALQLMPRGCGPDDNGPATKREHAEQENRGRGPAARIPHQRTGALVPDQRTKRRRLLRKSAPRG